MTIISKYNNTDFINYEYDQIYFGDTGTFSINGITIAGFPGMQLKIKISSAPVYLSGSDELYLLGNSIDCVCGKFDPAYTGNTSSEYPVGTPYYYGNIGMGIWNGENDQPSDLCFWMMEDNCIFTDETGCLFLMENET